MAKTKNDTDNEPLAEGTASNSETEVEIRPRRRRDRRDRGVRLQEGSKIREPGIGDSTAELEPLQKDSKNSVTLLGVANAFNLVRKVSDKMASKKQGKTIIKNNSYFHMGYASKIDAGRNSRHIFEKSSHSIVLGAGRTQFQIFKSNFSSLT